MLRTVLAGPTITRLDVENGAISKYQKNNLTKYVQVT